MLLDGLNFVCIIKGGAEFCLHYKRGAPLKKFKNPCSSKKYCDCLSPQKKQILIVQHTHFFGSSISKVHGSYLPHITIQKYCIPIYEIVLVRLICKSNLPFCSVERKHN